MEYRSTAVELEALLTWINNKDLVGRSVPTTQELSDGKIIWEVLLKIDAETLEEIPHRDSADRLDYKVENLQKAHEFLVTYIESHSASWPAQLAKYLDLENVAKNTSATDTNKLLKLVLFAVATSIKLEEGKEPMSASALILRNSFMKLDDSVGECLREIITEAVQKQDRELELEAQNAQISSENEKLRGEIERLNQLYDGRNAAINVRDERIKGLEGNIRHLNERIINLKSGKGDYGFREEHLHVNARKQQEDFIADLEDRLSSAEEEKDRLRKEVQLLRDKVEAQKHLQDELDILNSQHQKVRKEAEVGRKYREKLGELGVVVKENDELKKEISALRNQIKVNDLEEKAMAEQQIKLEKYEKMVSHIEQDLHESRGRREALEISNQVLEERVRSLEEEMNRLRGGLGESEYEDSHRSPTPTTGTRTPNLPGNLQQDLEALGLGESTLYLEDQEKPDNIDDVESFKGDLGDEHSTAVQEEDKAKLVQEMLKPVEEAKERLANFITQHTGEGSEAIQQSLEDLTKQISELIEKDHERLAQRAQYIHQQNEQIKTLRNRISQLEKADEESEANNSEDDAISKEREFELQKQIESLSRELALMSSSWYELQGKLHNTNNVPISRYRHGSAGLVDAQKGWLARQRSAVVGR
ncbi:putative microtubule binding protein HOOK3 [Aspergillus lucknowensis]|uniref:HOOK N-terminal domain-containing protein n=1 Tax=Aspergillus lucknowensis TaxID=176173 RepID=A0ABR4LHJ5_9EURO